MIRYFYSTKFWAKTDFYITDLLGTMVLKGTINESSEINIDHLQSSMYFIHIDNQSLLN